MTFVKLNGIEKSISNYFFPAVFSVLTFTLVLISFLIMQQQLFIMHRETLRTTTHRLERVFSVFTAL